MRGDQTLDDLHEAIFGAFDRFDSRLYFFYVPKARRRRSPAGPIPTEYAAPFMVEEPDPFGTERRFNAARTRLDILGLQVGQQFEYLFDFGDS
jgi:pRiA4b ORF-3-like protein